MATYYEMLKIPQTATVAEIEAALDAQHDLWRKLVIHYDPAYREQADRSLRVLETIRSTLSDPAKRAVYDASLIVGGLADPTALLQQAGGMPPPTKPGEREAHPLASQVAETGLWQCPQCTTANPIGTGFCHKCGTQVGRECPNCDHRIYVRVAHCPDCGVDVDDFDVIKLQMQQTARSAAANLRFPAIVAAIVDRPHADLTHDIVGLAGKKITNFIPASHYVLRVNDTGGSVAGETIYKVGKRGWTVECTIRVSEHHGNRLYHGVLVVCTQDRWSLVDKGVTSLIADEVFRLIAAGARTFPVRL